MGVRVRATHLRNSLSREHDFQLADILNPSDLVPLMSGIHCVIHAAGLAHVFSSSKATAALFRAVNETGTLNVAEAAAQARVRHFVLISSVAVYGESASVREENSVCRPQGAYAESKWRAERHAIEIAKATGMRLTILRLATLYGEGDPGNVARLMRLIDRRRFVWIGDGSNRKSLIYREDAARACLTVLSVSGGAVDLYNVSAPPCTVRELVEGLASALSRRVPGWRIPASLAQGLTGLAARLSRDRGFLGDAHASLQKWLTDDVYDSERFRQVSGFETKVELTEGLRREVAWYRGRA